jgi:hypothetical protein
MRTAIFVYEPALINISTSETDLQLLGMDVDTLALCEGNNSQTIGPGIYKIDSSHEVVITGDTSSFDVVASSGKDNDPTPPLRATSSFASLDGGALHAFLSAPNAKTLLSP